MQTFGTWLIAILVSILLYWVLVDYFGYPIWVPVIVGIALILWGEYKLRGKF